MRAGSRGTSCAGSSARSVPGAPAGPGAETEAGAGASASAPITSPVRGAAAPQRDCKVARAVVTSGERVAMRWSVSNICSNESMGQKTRSPDRAGHAGHPEFARPRATLSARPAARRAATPPWGCSSAGRAPRSHRGGQGFESPHLHHFPTGQRNMSRIAVALHASARQGIFQSVSIVRSTE